MLHDSSTHSLSLHLLWFSNDLVRSSLHDTPGPGQRGTDAHEIFVDVASCLATFVDAPDDN